MARKGRRRLKPWQRFLKLADEDLLAFAVLFQANMMDRACYCGQQAIEKYLKAYSLKIRQGRRLSLSIFKPSRPRKKKGPKRPTKNPWLFDHDLGRLLEEHRKIEPSYQLPASVKVLARITTFEVIARYPARRWGFSSDDAVDIAKIAAKIRSDLRIRDDYYPLQKGLKTTAGYDPSSPDPIAIKKFLGNLLSQNPWTASALALRDLWWRLGFGSPDSMIVGKGRFRGQL